MPGPFRYIVGRDNTIPHATEQVLASECTLPCYSWRVLYTFPAVMCSCAIWFWLWVRAALGPSLCHLEKTNRVLRSLSPLPAVTGGYLGRGRALLANIGGRVDKHRRRKMCARIVASDRGEHGPDKHRTKEQPVACNSSLLMALSNENKQKTQILHGIHRLHKVRMLPACLFAHARRATGPLQDSGERHQLDTELAVSTINTHTYVCGPRTCWT